MYKYEPAGAPPHALFDEFLCLSPLDSFYSLLISASKAVKLFWNIFERVPFAKIPIFSQQRQVRFLLLLFPFPFLHLAQEVEEEEEGARVEQ